MWYYLMIIDYGKGCENLSYAYLRIGSDSGVKIPYKEGMNQLRILEKKLGQLAKMTVNEYDIHISYKTICGYVK